VDLVFAGSPSAMLVAGRDDGTWDDPRALATDRCELLAIADFNGDGSPDLATDGRFEGVPVVAFLANRTVGATSSDCNRNALPDDCEIASGAEQDVNRNRVIDACEADCDRDGIPDSSAIATGASRDCDGNDVPDSCDIARGLQVDANANGVPDVCDPDCNGNRIPDFRDIALGRARDCNANGIPDGCEIEGSELLFPAASRIPTGRYPLSLVAADFNGDGIADLANTNGDDDTIGVFLGPGDGTFPEARSFPSTGRPLSLVTADWNGDGSLDLAATDTDSLELSVLFGEGDGGFHPEARVPVAVTPWWALALDLNVDGQPDIGVLDINTGFVSIVHGLGTGSFATPSLHDVGLGRPRSFTAADVTEDGILDLITSDEAPRGVSVFRGTSDSRYVERGHLPIMSLVGALVPADLNEDGHQDLAACTSGGVAILLGRGGNFIVQATYNPRAIPGSLLVRDLDGDGALDIATANTDTGDVSVLLGHGEGAFLPVGTFAAGPEARDIEAADFDRDGLLDLATCSARDHAIAIVRGQARGSFQGARHEGLGMASRGLVVTDLNQDGALDIVAGDHEATEALIILGRSDGSLEAARVFPTGDLPPEAIAAGDVNGDGFPDLAAATRLPSEVNVALGDGDGWFLPAVGYSPGEGTDPESILVVDLNGDGASEVITGDTGTEEIAVFLGSPDGQLGTARRFPGINERGKIRAAGDFNADGEMDLVVTDERAVGVARGNGDGTLLGPRLQATGRTAGLALGDFNRDGILDLVVVGLGSFSADRLHGRGDGTFEPAPGIGLGAPAWGVAAADLDRDGSLDLAFPLAEAEEVRVLRALPDGSFGHSTSVRVGAQPHGDLAAADMDRDGAPDLVFIRSLHDVAIVYNRTAAPAIDCNQNGVPDSCDLESGSSFDRDGDGLPDECRTEAGRQVPGDCNQDGALAISDPLCLIGFLFLGSERLPCGTGAASDRGNLALIDVQPDGRINIADVVHVLHFLFLGGPPPALVASADGAGCAPVEGCIEGPGCR
jgi:hypothetical protein